MRVTAKFGFTPEDALRLLREAVEVHIFVGHNDDDGDNRFILEVSKASLLRDLKRTPAYRGRLCHLEVDTRTLYFGSFRAQHHAGRVAKFNARRAAAVAQ